MGKQTQGPPSVEEFDAAPSVEAFDAAPSSSPPSIAEFDAAPSVDAFDATPPADPFVNAPSVSGSPSLQGGGPWASPLKPGGRGAPINEVVPAKKPGIDDFEEALRNGMPKQSTAGVVDGGGGSRPALRGTDIQASADAELSTRYKQLTGSGKTNPFAKPDISEGVKGIVQEHAILADNLRDMEDQYEDLQEQQRNTQPQFLAGIDKQIGDLAEKVVNTRKVLKEGQDIFDAQVAKDIDKELSGDIGHLTQRRSGFDEANPAGVAKAAKKIVDKYGDPSDNLYRTVYNRLEGSTDSKVAEAEAEANFKTMAGPLMDKIKARGDSAFASYQSEFARNAATIDRIRKQTESDMGAEMAALSKAFGDQVTAIDNDLAKQRSALEGYLEALNGNVQSGRMDPNSANAEWGKAQSGFNAAAEERNKQVEQVQANYEKEANKLQSRYNAQFQQQQKGVLKNVEQRIAEAQEAYNKAVQVSPEDAKELRNLYGKAWDKTLADRAARKENMDKAQYDALSTFNPQLAFAAWFGKSMLSGLGGSVKRTAYSLGSRDLYTLGSEMERAFLRSEPSTKELSDLLDMRNLAGVSGQLAGGMAPSLVAAGAVSAATGGLGGGVGAQLVGSALAGWATESLDIAGGIKDRVYRETNDVRKADKAGRDAWVSQMQLLPTYAFEGLPFIGKALEGIGSRGLRMGVGGLTEYTTELFQELPQNIAEDNIAAGRPAWEDFGEKLMGPQTKETMIQMVPLVALGASGHIANPGEELEKAAKAYMAKSSVAEKSQGLVAQWINGMVQAHGDNFAGAVIEGLEKSGNIKPIEARRLQAMRQEVAASMADAKQVGLNNEDAQVYTAFKAKARDLKHAAIQAQSPDVKAFFEAKAKAMDADAASFLSDKQGNYVRVKYADGTSSLLSVGEAKDLLTDPGFIRKAVLIGDDLVINGFGNESGPMLDEFYNKVERAHGAQAAFALDPANAQLTVIEKKEALRDAVDEAIAQLTANEQPTKKEHDGKGSVHGEVHEEPEQNDDAATAGDAPAGSTDGTVPQGTRTDGNTPAAPNNGQREVPAAEATDEEAATGVPPEGKPADEDAAGRDDADLAILGLAPKKKAKPAKQPVGDVPKAAPRIAEPIPPRSPRYRLIEDVSDEPQDLASAYIDDMHLYHDDGNPQSVLSALTTANVDKGSYAMFGDRNHITASFAKTYFRKRGRTVDDIAQEASDITGMEITPDDVVEFMHDNPGGRPMRSERMAELADRYKEVTGKKLNKLSAKALLKKARRNPIARAAIVTGLDEADVIEHYKQAQEEWDAYTDEQKQAIFDQHEQAEKAIYEATPDEGAGEVGGSVPRGIDSQEEEERSQGEEVATPADKEREALVENLDAAKKERASFEKRFRKRGESLFDEGDVETRKDRAKGKKAEPGLFGDEGDTRANSSDDFAKAVKPYDDAVTVAQRALDEHDAGAGKRKDAAAQQTRVDEAPAGQAHGKEGRGFPDYDAWSRASEAKETIAMDRHHRRVRNMYDLPDGTEVYVDAVFPGAFGAKNYTQTVAWGFVLPLKGKWNDVLGDYDGFLGPYHYGDTDNYGNPVFNDGKSGDSLRNAYNFFRDHGVDVRKFGYEKGDDKKPVTPQIGPGFDKDGMPIKKATSYTPPKDTPNDDWNGSERDDFTPTERQKPIIDAVQKALDAGLFYADDMRANVAEQLGVADPSGQVFGMDVHHAERYLDAKRQRDSGERDRKLLNPKVGDQLGTLVFTDGTTIKKATLTAVGEVGPVMQVSGMKGRSKFHLTTNPGAIMAAMDRAKENGLRADDSKDYVSAKGGGTILEQRTESNTLAEPHDPQERKPAYPNGIPRATAPYSSDDSTQGEVQQKGSGSTTAFDDRVKEYKQGLSFSANESYGRGAEVTIYSHKAPLSQGHGTVAIWDPGTGVISWANHRIDLVTKGRTMKYGHVNPALKQAVNEFIADYKHREQVARDMLRAKTEGDHPTYLRKRDELGNLVGEQRAQGYAAQLVGPKDTPTTGITHVDKVIRALSEIAPGTKVYTYTNNAEYNRQAKERGGKSGQHSSAFYDNRDGSIHINLKRAKDNTLFHEAAHPVMKAVIAENPELLHGLYDQLADHPDFGKYKKFAERYEEDQRKVEAVVEYMADVAAGKARSSALPGSMWQKFKAWVKDMLNKLGFRGVNLDPANLKQFAEDFATAVTEGRKIKLRKLAEEQGTVSLQDDADRLVDGWYSRLDDAVVDKGQTMPASQWQDWVKARAKEGKFSMEEAKWTGLYEWLAGKGKEKVTPKEVRAFLKENRVEVKVEVLGSPSEGDIEAFLNDEAGQGYSREDAIEYLNKEEGATKHSAYQLPGGTNYQEVLVTLPNKQPVDDVSGERASMVPEKDEYGWRVPGFSTHYPTPDQAIDGAMEIRGFEAANKSKERTELFRSTHFDPLNILVHLRVNDRVMDVPFTADEEAAIDERNRLDAERKKLDAHIITAKRKLDEARKPEEKRIHEEVMEDVKAGRMRLGDAKQAILDRQLDLSDSDSKELRDYRKLLAERDALTKRMPEAPKRRQEKVLFIEELQSDWGQEGRNSGFREEWTPEDEAQWNRLTKMNGPRENWSQADQELADRLLEKSNRKYGTAQAPFVTSTEGWVELGLKQAVRMAVDGGYDRIAWASGEQQNERYDLSKQVSEVAWERNPDGTYGISVFGKEDPDRTILEKENQTPDQLADIVGKDVAKRITDDEGVTTNGRTLGSIIGDGLKAGGSGMKGFYDKILPTEAKKVSKKLGGDGKVGDVVFGTPKDAAKEVGTQQSIAITPAMRERVSGEGVPLMQAFAKTYGITVEEAKRQYDEVVSRYTNPDGTKKDGWMKAPNGKPTKLNEQQWVQTRTPAFKNWFGDWEGDPAGASKVVDENGEPMVVYHGTAEDFDIAIPSRMGESGSGIYLTPSFSDASKWASKGLSTKQVAQGANILPLYANLRNPIEGNWNVYKPMPTQDAEDGAIRKSPNGNIHEIVARDSTQIKSATGNTGQYDPANPNINEQLTDKEGNNLDPSEVAARAKKANIPAAKVRGIMERNGEDEADIRAVEKAMKEEAEPNVFTMDDADMEDYFDSHFGKKAKGAVGQFSNARNAKYIFRDQAHFNAWMAERYAEGDLDGMREAFAEADSRAKVAYVRDVQRRGDEHEKGWAANIGTGAPLPTGRQPVQRTTPRPLPQGGFTGGPTDAPPAGPPTPPTPPRSPSGRKKFNFTALVQLMQEFGNVPQVNRALRAALGKQKGDVTELMERLLWDQDLATEVLGHEIGHFIDRMIEVSGNRKGFARRMAPLREFSKEVNKELKDEAKALSRAWRGDFAADDKYRNSASELFADVMSALFNDPEWVNQKFPRIHDTFQDLLDGKPEFKAAYDELTDRIDGGQVADEWMRQQEEDRTKSIDEVLSPKRSSDEGMRGQLKGLFVSPWYRIMQIEGKQRNRDIGETYIDRLEISNMFHMRANAVFESDFREKVAPLLKKVDPSDPDEAMKRLHWYIQANRTINERRAAGKWFEDNPSAAKELLSRLAHMEPVLRLFAPDVARLRDGQEAYDLAARMIRKVHELDRNKKDGPAVTRVAKAIDKMNLGADGDATMVAFNVRGKLLNPGGLTPETALQVVEKIRDEIGDERFAALEAAQRQLSDLLYQAQKAAADEGLISQKVFNEVIAPNRGNYAPYAVLDYWGGRVGGRMAEQVGTAKGIADTVVATQMKVAAINSWRKQQHIAKTLVDAYRSAGAEELMTIGEALDDVRDIEAIRAKHRDDDKSRLVMWVDGTPHVVEFGNDPGKSFERAHESENFRESLGILSRAPGALQATMQLYTVLTPNFWLRNIPRGLFTAMGRLGTGNVLRSTFNPTRQQKAARMAWNYAKAAHGHPMLPEVKALVENGVLAPPRFSRAMSFDAENQRILMMGGIMMGFDAGKYAGKDTAWTRSALKRHAVDKLALLSSAYEGYEKVINYLTLQAMEGITEQKAAGVAMRAGIPKGGVSGRNRMLNIGVETLMPWTRVSIQGERSALDIWRDPQLGSGYKKRLFVFEVLPRLVNLGVGMGVLKMLAGLFGDDEDKDGKLGLAGAYATAMQRVSPYKSGLDRMFPLAFYDPHTGEYTHIADWQDADHVPEHLEVVSARIPSSEEGRVWMPLLHNMVANQSPAMAIAGKGNLEILGDWATSTVTPGLNPVLELAWQAGYKMVVNGENPDDDFTHYPMANPLLFNAGWGDGRGQAIAGAVFDRTGGPGKAIGDALIGMGVMDPRAMKPASVRLKGDFTPLAEQVMFLRPFVSFDNAAPRREARVAKEASEELRGKAMSVMSPEVQELYTFYQRNKGKKDKMDARERVRLAAAGEMMKQVWGEAIVTHPNEEGRLVTDTLNLDMGRPYKMPGTTMSYHIYGRALAAAANKGSRMLMKDLRQELDSLAAPYRAVFDDPDTYIYATGDTGDE